MVEYIAKAFAAWFIGFFPYFEIYVAVPAAIAMGLDYFSAVTWSVFGMVGFWQLHACYSYTFSL